MSYHLPKKFGILSGISAFNKYIQLGLWNALWDFFFFATPLTPLQSPPLLKSPTIPSPSLCLLTLSLSHDTHSHNLSCCHYRLPLNMASC